MGRNGREAINDGHQNITSCVKLNLNECDEALMGYTLYMKDKTNGVGS